MDRKRPARRWWRSTAFVCALACAFPAHADPLSVTALQRNGRPLVGAVITVESDTSSPAPPVQAVMDQVDLAFEPDVLVIPVHSSVQFPNSDEVNHQVYSFSPAKAFQLPLYRGKPYAPVVFDQPGVITLGCNIHDNMLAYIVVTRAPHFGRTDAQGRWTLAELPPGAWRVRLWHPLLNETADVERRVDAPGTVGIRLDRSLRPAPLSKRPHSWDY